MDHPHSSTETKNTLLKQKFGEEILGIRQAKRSLPRTLNRKELWRDITSCLITAVHRSLV